MIYWKQREKKESTGKKTTGITSVINSELISYAI